MTAAELEMYNLGVAAMQLLLVWLVCAVVAWMIGRKKGTPGIGFLAGLLLGPIGVLAIILSSGDRAPCPFCREPVRAGATACPHCQRDLPQPEAPSTAPSHQKPLFSPAFGGLMVILLVIVAAILLTQT